MPAAHRSNPTRAVVLALGCALPVVALASEDDGGPPAVIISASPRAQSVRDWPAAITQIDAVQALATQPKIDLSEALAAVPGLVAQSRQNYAQDAQISTRGFGARAAFGVRGVRIHTDGIPASMPDGQGQVSHVDLDGAARIEVLRGPFSVLHGNAAGGVLAVTSADGAPGDAVGLSAVAGSDGLWRVDTVVRGGRDGDATRWRIRADAGRFRTDGFRDHGAAERRQADLRAAIDWGGTRLVLLGNWLDQPEAQDPLGLTRAQFDSAPRSAGSNALAFNTRKTLRQGQGGISVSQNFSRGQAAVLTVWDGHRDVVQYQSIPRAVQATPTHGGGVVDLSRDYGGFDLRATGALADGAVTVTAGVSRETMDDARRGYENFQGDRLGVRGALRRDEDNRFGADSSYLQIDWIPAEAWRLVAGARRATLTVRSSDHFITTLNPDDSGATEFADTTPALGVTWHANAHWSLYGAWGRGFETPTGNELAYRADGASGINLALRPARSRHAEAGAKWRDGARRFEMTAFTIGTTDEIVVAASSGGRTAYRNGGDTSRHGLEWSMQDRVDRPSGRYDILMAASWLSARYAGDSTVSGRRLPGVPPHHAFVQLTWRPAGSDGVAGPYAQVEWQAAGRVAVNDANADHAPGHAVANVAVGLAHRAGPLAVKLFARADNVFARRYAGSVIVNESNGRFYEPAPGRHWLVGLDASLAWRP